MSSRGGKRRAGVEQGRSRRHPLQPTPTRRAAIMGRPSGRGHHGAAIMVGPWCIGARPRCMARGMRSGRRCGGHAAAPLLRSL